MKKLCIDLLNPCLCLFFLMLVSINAVYVQAQGLAIERNEKSIQVSNRYYNLVVDPQTLHLLQFNSQEKSFLKTHIDENGIGSRGLGLVLYKKHPKQSSDFYQLPSRYSVNEIVQNASSTSLIFSSTGDTDLSVKQSYGFYEHKSLFNVTTVISNQTDSTIDFFPTEIATWDAEVGDSDLPNMNVYFNLPLQNVNPWSFEVLQGSKDANDIKLNEHHKLMYVKNKFMLNEFEIDIAQHWYAVVNGIYTNPKVWAFSYQYPDIQPKQVEDNFYLFINGAGKQEIDGETVNKDFSTDKFIFSRHVLGKVTLKPGETFSFTKIYSLTTTPGPIIKFEGGVAINQDFKVYRWEQGYVVTGIMGIPQEGLLTVEFYDDDGKRLERNAPSLNLDPLNQSYDRPGYVAINYPTVLMTEIWFGMDAEQEGQGIVDYGEIVRENTSEIRLYLTDFKRNHIQMLAKQSAPFEYYPVPEQNQSGTTQQ